MCLLATIQMLPHPTGTSWPERATAHLVPQVTPGIQVWSLPVQGMEAQVQPIHRRNCKDTTIVRAELAFAAKAGMHYTILVLLHINNTGSFSFEPSVFVSTSPGQTPCLDLGPSFAR